MDFKLKSAQEQLQIVQERLSDSSDKFLSLGIDLLDNFLHGFLLGEMAIFYGSSSSYALADLLIVRALFHSKVAGFEGDVIYIDGGNRFNLYRISTLARQYGLDVKTSLRRIHVSRAFTSHQLATLTVRELSRELERHPSQLIVVSDLLSISRDEEVKSGEARVMLNLSARSLRDLTTEAQLVTLLPNSKLTVEREQSSLVTCLWPKADIILHLRELKNRTRILREKHPFGDGQIDIDLRSLKAAVQVRW